MMRSLDPDAVHAFVLLEELKSFTRVARVLNSTQSAVSLRLQRLEKHLGKRLIERTPRLVRLSSDGAAFLEPARAIVTAHRRAAEAFEEKPARIAVGISHHIVGAELPSLVRQLQANSSVILDLQIGPTRDLLESYDAGKLDAVLLLRYDESRRSGEVVITEQFSWMAAPGFDAAPDLPLPLALQAESCKLRAMAVTVLNAADIKWREAFLGTGIFSIGAAVAGGIAVAALPRRIAPVGAVDVAKRFGLPALPKLDVVLHSNVTDHRTQPFLKRLIAGIRTTDMPAAAGARDKPRTKTRTRRR